MVAISSASCGSIDCALLADQYFRIGKVSFHRTTLMDNTRENECAPRLGAEFFLHVSWSAVGHFFPMGWVEFIRAS
jgi:hypothetical protein